MNDAIKEWHAAYEVAFADCELPHTFAISPIHKHTRAVTIEVESRILERRANWTISVEMFTDSIQSVREIYLRNLRQQLEKNS
jgi:hypothetical protein